MSFYLVGDPHRDFRWLSDFCRQLQTTKEDVLIILGDAGINLYGFSEDDVKKAELECLPITLFCVHGNHENRASNIVTYREIDWHGGKVYREELFPSLLFAKDGEVYDIEGLDTLVVGGAYSIDWRRRLGYRPTWWRDEQPSEEIKLKTELTLADRDWQIDTILTHTAPLVYEPVEMFLPGVNQAKVDKSTEEWLAYIETTAKYRRWFCGHYHTDKQIDRLTFMMFDVREWKTGEKVYERSREWP